MTEIDILIHTILHSNADEEDYCIFLINEYICNNKNGVNDQDRLGFTLLSISALKGFSSVCRILLEKYKADPDIQTTHLKTALHFSLSRKYLEIADMLLRNYANPLIQDMNKRNAFDYARERGVLDELTNSFFYQIRISHKNADGYCICVIKSYMGLLQDDKKCL